MSEDGRIVTRRATASARASASVDLRMRTLAEVGTTRRVHSARARGGERVCCVRREDRDLQTTISGFFSYAYLVFETCPLTPPADISLVEIRSRESLREISSPPWRVALHAPARASRPHCTASDLVLARQ